MSVVKAKQKTLFSLFFLSLFTLFQVSTSLFTHVHHAGGVLIAHSHPNNGEHDHTSEELLLISLLAEFHVSDLLAGEDFIWLMPYYCELSIDCASSVASLQLPEYHLLRAPPYFVI